MLKEGPRKDTEEKQETGNEIWFIQNNKKRQGG